MRDPRLGDDIDDFCVRCKRVMNHSVVSVLENKPAKVRCRTCHSDHDFRNEQAPPPKVDLRKQALYQEVLKKVDPSAEAAGADGVPAVADELDAVLETDLEMPEEISGEDVVPEIAMEAEAGAVMEAPAAPAAKAGRAPKPSSKAAAKPAVKGRARK